MFVLFALLACSDNTLIVDGEPSQVGVDDTADQAALDAEWDGARLEILSPLSASFLPMEEAAAFSAVVYAADGTPTTFSDVTWSTDVDSSWTLLGATAEDGSLPVGTHAITAEAVLPNGDRLAYTVGGVLVQSIYAGVYVGDLAVTASGEYQGQEISLGCSGALTIVVEADGETGEGDAGCLLSLLGYDIDTAYLFELENDAGAITGTASIDLQIYALPVDTSGELTEEGELSGSFAADVAGFLAFAGEYEATRITRDLSTAQ